MIKRLLLILLLVLPLRALAAETSEDELVLAVVDQFFVGLKERDLSLWEDILVPEGTVMVNREKDGAWTFRNRTIQSDLERLETDTALVDERIYTPTVLVHETIAVVWTPYDIYVDGQFIHCGIDVFQLLKIEGKWKIVQIAYTTEPEGCEALGVAPR